MQKWIIITAFLPSVVFPFAALVTGLRNPTVFDASILLISSPFSAAAFSIAFGAVLILRNRSTRLHENFSGLLLFFFFTAGYFLLASIFNKPDINTNNLYFAADNWSWHQRMAAEDGWNTGTRAVHPLAFILFRPPTALLSLFTGGNRFHANLILLALAGGGCVFLMWKILRQVSGNPVFTVLFASLLGLSASHLIFASVIESYIFSTFGLLLFAWLLLNNRPIHLLAVTGVVTLGITITNIAQQALMALLVHKNYKRVAILFFAIILFAIGLNIISHFGYPATEYFFIPRNLTGEQRFSQEINLKRVGLLVENMLIYNIAAPQPYQGFQNKALHFNFLNGTIGEYVWFGWPALVFWTMILILAFFMYFKNSAHKHISIAMLACLLFNFILHIGYGIEPFLYSADWTYALILFIAFSLGEFAERTWFNMGLLVVVLSIFVNNLWVVYLIARRASEFLV